MNDLNMMTSLDDQVWQKLCELQIPQFERFAIPEFKIGWQRLGLDTKKVPTLNELNAKLKVWSTFQVVPVTGLVSTEEFFDLLDHNLFPVVTTLRSSADHLSTYDPDLWHDVAGHLAFLTIPEFASLYNYFGKLARTKKLHGSLAALYWYSIEFGIINNPITRECKIYGAGILPSPLEVETALSLKTEKREFDPIEVVNRQFVPGALQPVLYWVESIDSLKLSLKKWADSVEIQNSDL